MIRNVWGRGRAERSHESPNTAVGTALRHSGNTQHTSSIAHVRRTWSKHTRPQMFTHARMRHYKREQRDLLDLEQQEEEEDVQQDEQQGDERQEEQRGEQQVEQQSRAGCERRAATGGAAGCERRGW